MTRTSHHQAVGGPAFVRMTAQFVDELDRNAAPIPDPGKLDSPVKIIRGENDPDLTADHARDSGSYLRNASPSLLLAGHWPQVDEPALVAAEMPS